MRQAAIAIAGSIFSAVYWWSVFAIVYADVLFAGDRNPALRPAPDRQVVVQSGLTILIAVLLFAALSALWHRLTRGVQRTT